MNRQILVVSAFALIALPAIVAPAQAASFSCMDLEGMTRAEQRVCTSRMLGALDERLDSWYRRALVRAGYFDQTKQVKRDQRQWIQDRNACGGSVWCLRSHYVKRIRQLKNYVEHV